MAVASGEKTLNVLGATILSMAAEAGVYKHTEIRRRLEAAGLKVSAPGFSAWLYVGGSAAPRTLPQAFGDAFALEEEKILKLAVAYSYGQMRPFTEAGELPLL